LCMGDPSSRCKLFCFHCSWVSSHTFSAMSVRKWLSKEKVGVVVPMTITLEQL
jgi:hypothetical protein